ncbi:fimbrial protein [Escherichia coli O8:H49]
MNKNTIYGLLLSPLFWSMLLPVTGHASNVGFKGNLLDRPCQIAPSSATQDVVFRETATPLYHVWPGRSYEEKFQIKLVNCHELTIGKTVKLTFSGKEESKLPGYLQVMGVNQGRLGIGIIDTDGKRLLKINEFHNSGKGETVLENNVVLNFKAFVQATEDAIAKKNVIPGGYSATVTFELIYI